jgi:hypothetical protein
MPRNGKIITNIKPADLLTLAKLEKAKEKRMKKGMKRLANQIKQRENK